ncbi:MAG TPA: CAP domain-containing protein [Candidatus Limnocylindrales bacterium]|nr:CAP domain-containing protein [Candidatus Limnocylindrales bacterium]
MDRHRRLALVGALVAVLATALGPGAHPAPTDAATALSPTPDAVETTFINWINGVRASKGLVPLRVHPGLVKMAGDWAAHSASTAVLSLPSCMSCMLTSYGVQKYNYGGMESWSSYPWGDQAIASIESGWRQHSTEWSKLMSSTLNYIGIGVAYRSSNHSMWVAVFETESKDRTNPWAKPGTTSRSGSTVTWSWSGGDTKLQTHTAGFKNYDVQYRVDSGTWTTIKSATTAKSLSLSSRAGGHYYGLRVRSRDNLGYVSAWGAEMRVWVP